jgi:putative FmdB family regulatory protein
MPIYEYRCDKGHTFEVLQRMSDDALEVCTTCGAPVQRVFHPVAVHFKGSGFYNTDYGKQKRGKADESGGDSDSSSSKSDSGSGSGGSSDSDKSGEKSSAGSSSGSDSSKSKAASSSSKSSGSD